MPTTRLSCAIDGSKTKPDLKGKSSIDFVEAFVQWYGDIEARGVMVPLE